MSSYDPVESAELLDFMDRDEDQPTTSGTMDPQALHNGPAPRLHALSPQPSTSSSIECIPGPSRTAYVYDSRMMLHRTPDGLVIPDESRRTEEVEKPERIRAIFAKLYEAGCIARMVKVPCREVTRGEVDLVHHPRHWDKVAMFEGQQVSLSASLI